MPNPIISVRNLTTKFGAQTVLDDISFEINPREITVILGGSGCGKTTLVKNIVGLLPPDSGTIEMFGRDIGRLDEKEYETLLQRIGMLFQNGALLNSINVYENIAIPLEQHTDLPPRIIDNMIRVKLKLVQLENVSRLLPAELSGGMRKRAALARAIALDPEILFCDEPSAGLDPATSAALDELIVTLKNQLDMSIVIVTHELASIHRIADRILFLHQGQLLFQGTLDEARRTDISEVSRYFEIGSF